LRDELLAVGMHDGPGRSEPFGRCRVAYAAGSGSRTCEPVGRDAGKRPERGVGFVERQLLHRATVTPPVVATLVEPERETRNEREPG
jgi:hypothetical protein